ncbi:MAG: hypothetical protein P4M00_16720 [Azospirillaceae bacterium]|nr:hypothetical protein [Azospirillaceae bacterium]
MLALSESWHDEASILLTDEDISAIEAALPSALAAAERDQAPADPAEIVAALETWSSRRGLPLPQGLGLDLDIEALATWPQQLFRKAFAAAWQCFPHRRVPTAADFRVYIDDDLREAQRQIAHLKSLSVRLQTIQMRHRWNEDARAHHARIKRHEQNRAKIHREAAAASISRQDSDSNEHSTSPSLRGKN